MGATSQAGRGGPRSPGGGPILRPVFSLLVCDPHFPARAAVRLMARQALPTCAVDEVGDLPALLAALGSGRPYALLCLEPGLAPLGAAALVAQVRALRPDVPVLLLAADESPAVAAAALQAGALAYLRKSGPEEALFLALRDAMAGRSHLAVGRRDAAPRARAPLGMSPRQAEVLRCLMRGLTAKQIARALGISEGTVKTHTVAVFQALNVNSRTQAVVEAYRRGIPAES